MKPKRPTSDHSRLFPQAFSFTDKRALLQRLACAVGKLLQHGPASWSIRVHGRFVHKRFGHPERGLGAQPRGGKSKRLVP